MRHNIVVYPLVSHCLQNNCPHCIPHITMTGAYKSLPLGNLPFHPECYEEALFALEIPKNADLKLIQATEHTIAKQSLGGNFFLLLLEERESIVRFQSSKMFGQWKVKGWSYIIPIRDEYGKWKPRIVESSNIFPERTFFDTRTQAIWKGLPFRLISFA